MVLLKPIELLPFQTLHLNLNSNMVLLKLVNDCCTDGKNHRFKFQCGITKTYDCNSF